MNWMPEEYSVCKCKHAHHESFTTSCNDFFVSLSAPLVSRYWDYNMSSQKNRMCWLSITLLDNMKPAETKISVFICASMLSCYIRLYNLISTELILHENWIKYVSKHFETKYKFL